MSKYIVLLISKQLIHNVSQIGLNSLKEAKFDYVCQSIFNGLSLYTNIKTA